MPVPTPEQLLEAENRSQGSTGQLLQYHVLCAGTPAETAVAAIQYEQAEQVPGQVLVSTRVVCAPGDREKGTSASLIVHQEWRDS